MARRRAQGALPYFGGKHAVAVAVWARLGADVPIYAEPFAGSLAVLLARPEVPPGAMETLNDYVRSPPLAREFKCQRSEPGVAHCGLEG